MANRVDPDQMPHVAASDLGLLCLLKPQWGISEYLEHVFMEKQERNIRAQLFKTNDDIS